MKHVKALLAFLTLLIMASGVSGCSHDGGSADDKASADADKTGSFVSEDDGVYLSTISGISVSDEDVQYAQFAFARDGKVYFIVSVVDEETGDSTDCLRCFDEITGEIEGEDVYFTDEEEELNVFDIAPCGDDGYVFFAMNYPDKWLGKCSLDGKTTFKKKLSDIPEIRSGAVPQGGIVCDGKNTYITLDKKVIALDEEFKYIDTAAKFDIGGMCAGDDGLLYSVDFLSNNMSTFDPKTCKYEEGIKKIPRANEVFKGGPGEILITNNSTVKSYDIATGCITNLFNLIDVDINSQIFKSVYRDEEGDLHILYQDYGSFADGSEGVCCAKVKRYDAADAPKQKVIRFACYYLNSDIKNVIVRFNQSHPDVRIKVRAYMDDYVEEEDILAAFDKDILDDEKFDVVMLPSENVKKYSSKGFFEDLMPVMENDSSFDLSKYYENIIFATKEGEKLYTFTPGAIISCYLADSEVFGDKEKLTIYDMTEARSKYPDIPFINNGDRDEVFAALLKDDVRAYVGDKEGKYNFDTKEFRALCEFADSFPDWTDEYSEKYSWDNVSNENVKDGKEIIRKVTASMPSDYLLNMKICGKKFRIYGADTRNVKGYVLLPSDSFGIHFKSEHKEEAWEFIKAIADREPMLSWSIFSANKDTFEKCLTELREEGVNIMVDEVLYEIKATDENAALLRDMIENAEVAKTLDGPVMDIIAGEMPAYFAGEKSLDETIKIIQKRVNLYVEENR